MASYTQACPDYPGECPGKYGCTTFQSPALRGGFPDCRHPLGNHSTVRFQSPALRGGFPDPRRSASEMRSSEVFQSPALRGGFPDPSLALPGWGRAAGFNPLHYGEGFLTRFSGCYHAHYVRFQSPALRGGFPDTPVPTNPPTTTPVFQSPALRGGFPDAFFWLLTCSLRSVSIPCITGRVS